MQSNSGRGSTSGSSSSRRALLMGRTSPRQHKEVVMGNKEKQKKELVYNPELNLNYMMSKRRVPNGPDPIHNRNRPPGRA
ncbi:hypothetical protein HS088_TW22G00466 [Tripterygium wilfordii]|uniref:Uncharacterized protein n=2 Tax=Tripterygium wilfordii TaxID=458696 RepID=A0A7J7BY45_TRIWF|nr:hypothetical protein HS088_TW22G00466 [Tripterygium wilfordii]